MRALIVSDTHGRHGALELVLKRVGHIDLLIHCGDVEDGEQEIRSLVDCEVRMVRGNNDFFSSLESEMVFRIGSEWAFLTHGHKYRINYFGVDNLQRAAMERGASIVIFGHTHCPVLYESGGMTIMNPGSLSQPRQENRKPSYIIAETDGRGKAKFQLEFLEL